MDISNEELVMRIRSGERDLLLTLWEQVERLVRLLAFRYLDRAQGRCELDDLMQAGFLALLEAVRTFDPARGFAFSTWLRWPLKNHWAALCGLRTKKQRGDPLNKASSLDEPIAEDGESPLGDFIPDPAAETAFDDAENREWLRQLRQAIDAALDDLPPDCAGILRARFLEGLSLQQLAGMTGQSVEQLQRTERRGLRELRRPAAAQHLRPFLHSGEAVQRPGGSLDAFRQWRGSAVEQTVENLERDKR